MGKLLAALVCAGFAGAQAPDPPDPKTDSVAELSKSDPTKDDKHILGVVPNYTAVNQPEKAYHPASVSEKFMIAAHDSFDPFNWVIAGRLRGRLSGSEHLPPVRPGRTGLCQALWCDFRRWRDQHIHNRGNSAFAIT